MPVGGEVEAAAITMENLGGIQENRPKSKSPDAEVRDEEYIASDREIRTNLTRKNVKTMAMDLQIGLRNKDLAQWNNEYLQNMAVASKQKQQNKLPTLAKHNAAFWVFGQGIGSVGVGLGTSRSPHPLKQFSGDELYDSLIGGASTRSRKRGRPRDDESDTEGRRVRPRLDEEQDRRDDLPDEVVMQDVRINKIHSPGPWNLANIGCRTLKLAAMHPHPFTMIILLKCLGMLQHPSRALGMDPQLCRHSAALEVLATFPLAGPSLLVLDLKMP